MRTFFICTCLLLSGTLLTNCAVSNKTTIKNSGFPGFWVTENSSHKGLFDHIKVFEENGKYYNVSLENGQMIKTHQGNYKILDDDNYKEEVTDLRFNAVWDLKNNVFINNYEFNEDKKLLKLSGVVFSQDGSDSLKWSHIYKRVQIL